MFVLKTPTFDLPDNIHNCLLEDIRHKKFDGNYSYFTTKSVKHQPLLVKLLTKFLFGDVTFQTFQLTKESEELVFNYYKDFINFVNRPYKIRFKNLSNAKAMPPHSDVENSHRGTEYPKGDYCSIFVGIKTNQEITNWYTYSGDFIMDKVNPFKLKKKTSIRLSDRESCLFNNNAIHSVTNCKPENERWALAISWQDITYEELVQKYHDYLNTICN